MSARTQVATHERSQERGMHTDMVYKVPGFLIDLMRRRNLAEPDFHLYAAGRALGWVRMAADAIEADPYLDLKWAEYHSYAGISAARTAVDAVASWLNLWLRLGLSGASVSLTASGFLSRVSSSPLLTEKYKALLPHLDELARLARDELDPYRQRVQHREGPAVTLRAVTFGAGGRWHIIDEKAPKSRESAPDLVHLLRAWADRIEAGLRCVCLDLAAGGYDRAEP